MINSNSMNELKEAFMWSLKEQSYGKETLKNYRRIINRLDTYMSENKITVYTLDIGSKFLNDTITTRNLGKASTTTLSTVIRRFNDFVLGNGFQLNKKKSHDNLLPVHYLSLLKHFLEECNENGNKPLTIVAKKRFCSCFLLNLIELDCNDIDRLSPTIIGKACIMIANKDSWAVIRQFLSFLYRTNRVSHDYSGIIPIYKRRTMIPVTYTENEINYLEAAIDRTTPIGKRDFAFLLLATRLAMRSGDIVKLTYQKIDFSNDTISFNQEKTGEFLQLPLIPIIKDALMAYIYNARPASDSPFIFLRMHAPYLPITTTTLRFQTTTYFKKANIDISGKKHGLHSFRSSLASSMVNDNIPYEAVRGVLGHIDPDAIKHYAKLDIERLRDYAIDVPEPTGIFKDFLTGKRVL